MACGSGWKPDLPRGRDRGENASNYRGCLMAVECTINVGFHSNFAGSGKVDTRKLL